MPTKTRLPSRTRERVTPNPVESQGHEDTMTHQFDEQLPDLHARITGQAYALYEARGREDGGALEDWLEAERLVLNQGL